MPKEPVNAAFFVFLLLIFSCVFSLFAVKNYSLYKLTVRTLLVNEPFIKLYL